MNTRFNGSLSINKHEKHPRGYMSEAAKQAFADMRADKDIRVHSDATGVDKEVSIILNENILIYE